MLLMFRISLLSLSSKRHFARSACRKADEIIISCHEPEIPWDEAFLIIWSHCRGILVSGLRISTRSLSHDSWCPIRDSNWVIPDTSLFQLLCYSSLCM